MRRTHHSRSRRIKQRFSRVNREERIQKFDRLAWRFKKLIALLNAQEPIRRKRRRGMEKQAERMHIQLQLMASYIWP